MINILVFLIIDYCFCFITRNMILLYVAVVISEEIIIILIIFRNIMRYYLIKLK